MQSQDALIEEKPHAFRLFQLRLVAYLSWTTGYDRGYLL